MMWRKREREREKGNHCLITTVHVFGFRCVTKKKNHIGIFSRFGSCLFNAHCYYCSFIVHNTTPKHILGSNGTNARNQGTSHHVCFIAALQCLHRE